MKMIEQDEKTKAAQEALADSWVAVKKLAAEVTPNKIFSIDFMDVLFAIGILQFEALAETFMAQVVQTSTPPTAIPGEAERASEASSDSSNGAAGGVCQGAEEERDAKVKTLALALRLGLILVLLFRIGVMPIRGSKALRNALARAMHMISSFEGHRGENGRRGKEGGTSNKKPLNEKEKLRLVSAAIATQIEVTRQALKTLEGLRSKEAKMKGAGMSVENLFESVPKAGKFSKTELELSSVIEADGFAENRAKELTDLVTAKEERTFEDRPAATLFTGNGCASQLKGKIVVSAEHDGEIGGRTEHEKRTRYDLQVSVTEFEVDVERFTDVNEARYCGDTSHIGPKKCQHTWNALANILCLHAGYAIPMNRLESILSGQPFTREMMTRCIDKFSRSYAPVYEYMAFKVIANATAISVDDAHTRTNQTTRVAKAMAEIRESLPKNKDLKSEKDKSKADLSKSNDSDDDKLFTIPWANPDSLCDKIGKVLDAYPPDASAFLKKNAEGQSTIDVTFGKLTLQTTVVTCVDRTLFGKKGEFLSFDPNTPISYIDQSRVVFYRSDFRSAGCLLGEILGHRAEEAGKKLTIQGDLSSENHVKYIEKTPTKDSSCECTEPETTAKSKPKPKPKPEPEPKLPSVSTWLEIIYAGCAAHARRPFKRFYNDDPELCEAMINNFKDISLSEQIFGHVKLTPTELADLRNRMEKPLWSVIMFTAWMYIDKWSSATSLGKALRYILKGSDKLVEYIDNHELAWTNNFCENALRFEALNDSSSFGCDTYEGRVRLDILRTAYASAMATRIDPKLYMTFISIAAEDDSINESPENFTPGAFRRWQAIEVTSDSSCPCCKTSYGEVVKITPNRGITTCVDDCAHSFAKRAIAIMAQRF